MREEERLRMMRENQTQRERDRHVREEREK